MECLIVKSMEDGNCQKKRIWNELKQFQIKQLIISNETVQIKEKIANQIKKCCKQNDLREIK